MKKILNVFLLLPLLATAQLKEFEVSEMEQPDVAVVQANTQWPDDPLLLVYASLKDLKFRSSMSALGKVTTPKGVLSCRVEENKQTESGTLKIITEPSGADVFLNGSQLIQKTPFTGLLPSATYNIILQKAKYATIDTIIALKGGEITVFSVQLKPINHLR